VREYRTFYGLTKERVMQMKPHGIIMHPGPTNRGVEIDPDVADSKRSVILEQVKNGVALRMAALFIHAGGKIE
jgi:aspartate carbamoyltransferase catalytic subunit